MRVDLRGEDQVQGELNSRGLGKGVNAVPLHQALVELGVVLQLRRLERARLRGEGARLCLGCWVARGRPKG